MPLKKEELKALNQEFWSLFEQETGKMRSANNRKMNWAGYPSGIKDLFFRFRFTTQEAFFSIDLQMRDAGIRTLIFEQFLETQKLLQDFVGSEMEVIPSDFENDLEISRLKWQLSDVSLVNAEDYDKAIQFFKAKIKGMDAYWFEFSDLFVALCK